MTSPSGCLGTTTFSTTLSLNAHCPLKHCVRCFAHTCCSDHTQCWRPSVNSGPVPNHVKHARTIWSVFVRTRTVFMCVNVSCTGKWDSNHSPRVCSMCQSQSSDTGCVFDKCRAASSTCFTMQPAVSHCVTQPKDGAFGALRKHMNL